MRAFAAEQRQGLLKGAAAGGGGGSRLDILVNNAGGRWKRGGTAVRCSDAAEGSEASVSS